ncbi:MAG TPA: hypothetical protein PLO23_07175 [Alphaproteobacteria bacterium]|nr:hypothetical protein [Alphaproteobacteria bacterium]
MTTETDMKKQVTAALEAEAAGMAPEPPPASALGDKKKAEKRKRRIRMAQGAGFLVFCYIVYLLFIPFKGGMNFGACKVFLELYVRYPDTLNLSTVEDFGESYRIWFTEVDAFGQYRHQQIQCFYKPDETTGFAIDRVTIDRREVEQKFIDDFNRSLPTVLAFPPDLTYPKAIPDSLSDVDIDTDRFRRKIFE